MNAHNTNAGLEDASTSDRTPVTAGQWWKAWVLLTGLGVTVLGWMTLPRNEPAPVNGTLSSQMSMSAENSPVVRAERVDRPRGVSTGSIRALPANAREASVSGPSDTHATFLSSPCCTNITSAR